jgi:hypothetical protein
MRLSQRMRRRAYYTVERAGAMEPLCWSRTESYRGVDRGDIPVERDGRFLLVPRRLWDAEIKKLRQRMRDAGLKRRRPGRQPAPKAVAREAEAADAR